MTTTSTTVSLIGINGITNTRSSFLDTDLLLVAVGDIEYKTTFRDLKNAIRNSLTFDLFPAGVKDNALVHNGTTYVSGFQEYATHTKIPWTPAESKNVSVTWSNTATNITLNPTAINQEYIIRGTKYAITTPLSNSIGALVTPATNTRYDVVTLNVTGGLSYKVGTEAPTAEAVLPDVNGMELPIATIIVDNSGTRVVPGLLFIHRGTQDFKSATLLDSNGNTGTIDQALVLNASGQLVWTTIATGGTGANLALGTRTGTTMEVTSDTGTNATLLGASATEAGVMVASDKAKLNLITVTNAINLDALAQGTVGAVQLTDGSGVLTGNAANLVYASSSLGINKGAPTATVDAVKTTAGGTLLRLNNSSDSKELSWGTTATSSTLSLTGAATNATLAVGASSTELTSTSQLLLRHGSTSQVLVGNDSVLTESKINIFSPVHATLATPARFMVGNGAAASNTFLQFQHDQSGTLDAIFENAALTLNGKSSAVAADNLIRVNDSADNTLMTLTNEGTFTLYNAGVARGNFISDTVGSISQDFHEHRVIGKTTGIPASAIADRFVLYGANYEGVDGFTSPYVTCEDGHVINMRIAQQDWARLEFNASNPQPVRIPFTGDHASVQLVKLIANTTKVFSSLNFSVMRIADASAPAYQPANDFADVQAWTDSSGPNTIGGTAYTSPSSSADEWVLQIDPVFQPSWVGTGYVHILSIPKIQ